MITKKPSVFSLIYINFNSSDDLLLSLKSFIKAHSLSDIIFEVLIVDNCSTASEQKKLKQFPSLLKEKFKGNKVSLRLFYSPTNLGFGGANNFAVQQSRGEYLLFLNPDTLCEQELLFSFLPVLQQKKIGFVAPQLILPNHQPQLFAYGQFPTLGNTLLNKLSSSSLRLINKSSPIQTNWLSAACFAVSKAKFLQLGGFSPEFFMYFEDVDLCRKAAQKHYHQILLPQLQVIHFGGARSQLTRARRRAYFAAQKQYFYKWLPLQLPFLLFLRFPYQLYCYFKDKPSAS